jgi:hypothetical protein
VRGRVSCQSAQVQLASCLLSFVDVAIDTVLLPDSRNSRQFSDARYNRGRSADSIAIEVLTKRAARAALNLCFYGRMNYGCESGRRFSVGRSSSGVPFGSLGLGCFLDCSVLVRSVGLLGPS